MVGKLRLKRAVRETLMQRWRRNISASLCAVRTATYSSSRPNSLDVRLHVVLPLPWASLSHELVLAGPSHLFNWSNVGHSVSFRQLAPRGLHLAIEFNPLCQSWNWSWPTYLLDFEWPVTKKLVKRLQKLAFLFDFLLIWLPFLSCTRMCRYGVAIFLNMAHRSTGNRQSHEAPTSTF